MKFFFQKYSLYFAWIISIIAMSGSLYFSEVMKFIPCTLCWYQRIIMYPFVALLGIATFRNDKNIVIYALPLSIIGAGLSLYHYLLQKVPYFSQNYNCEIGIPCTTIYINWYGFITIPFLCMIAFVLISIFLFMARTKKD